MACTNCGPSLDTRGRNRIEPGWPDGGRVSRPLGDRRYEVQAFTGRPVSTVPEGRWSRGSIARFMAPAFTPNVYPLYMNDPTDPTRFVTVVSTQRKRGIVGGRKRGR